MKTASDWQPKHIEDNNNNNNLLIYSALFNIPGDQKRITTINNLKLYKIKFGNTVNNKD